MNRCFVAALVAFLGVLPAPALAQVETLDSATGESIRRDYRAVDASVVRVRTIATLEQEIVDPSTGLASTLQRPLSVYGTGVVIGEVFVDGQWEYLVMTNHHVADVSNYVISDGRFLRENRHNTRAVPTAPEESYVVAEERDEIAEDDILLVEIARDPRGDMTILRTVGTRRRLTPFPGRIGYRPGEVVAGARVITSGFPHAEEKILAIGKVLEVDRLHALGQPHEDFVVDLPVERGQSGSPVFAVESGGEGEETRFTLIGLLHASEKGEKFMVPYSLWRESLVGLPERLAQRLVH